MEKLRRILAAQKFHATLKGKLDAEISKVAGELDRQESRGGGTPDGLQGEYTEHPIDPDNIGTPAEALGGPISWSLSVSRDEQETEASDDPPARSS
tara:strand:+ start:3133 stop:3420 length:288 start_codon:yes stop_codon:yes gene_type:complete